MILDWMTFLSILPVLRSSVFLMTAHLSWADCWSNSSLTLLHWICDVTLSILSDWKQDWADELQAGVWQQFPRKHQLQRPAAVLTHRHSAPRPAVLHKCFTFVNSPSRQLLISKLDVNHSAHCSNMAEICDSSQHPFVQGYTAVHVNSVNSLKMHQTLFHCVMPVCTCYWRCFIIKLVHCELHQWDMLSSVCQYRESVLCMKASHRSGWCCSNEQMPAALGGEWAHPLCVGWADWEPVTQPYILAVFIETGINGSSWMHSFTYAWWFHLIYLSKFCQRQTHSVHVHHEVVLTAVSPGSFSSRLLSPRGVWISWVLPLSDVFTRMQKHMLVHQSVRQQLNIWAAERRLAS